MNMDLKDIIFEINSWLSNQEPFAQELPECWNQSHPFRQDAILVFLAKDLDVKLQNLKTSLRVLTTVQENNEIIDGQDFRPLIMETRRNFFHLLRAIRCYERELNSISRDAREVSKLFKVKKGKSQKDKDCGLLITSVDLDKLSIPSPDALLKRFGNLDQFF